MRYYQKYRDLERKMIQKKFEASLGFCNYLMEIKNDNEKINYRDWSGSFVKLEGLNCILI